MTMQIKDKKKVEKVAEMIYLGVRDKSMECFTWKQLIKMDSYIVSRCRQLAKKIIKEINL